jgi:hypothetical protein
METLFLPLAPNRVMGGVLANVPTERVSDLDVTVEEGVPSNITGGVVADADGTEGVDDRRFFGMEALVRRAGEEGAVSRVRGALGRREVVLGRESSDDDPAGDGTVEDDTATGAEVPAWEVARGPDDARPDDAGQAEETPTGETD